MSKAKWSSTTVTELLMFETLEQFRKDPSVCEPACRLVMTADGAHQPHHYGNLKYTDPDSQEPPLKKGCIICDWNSYEDHEAVLDGPLFPVVRGTLLQKSILSWDTSHTYHAILSGDPATLLDDPVVELTYLTVTEPEKNRKRLEEILKEISAAAWTKFVFGITHEDENMYMALWGWDSEQARQNALSAHKVLFDELWSLAQKNLDYLTATRLSKAWLCPPALN